MEVNKHELDIPSQFLCEKASSKTKKTNNLTELSQFLFKTAKIAYSIPGKLVGKDIYMSHKFLTASWFEARYICKAFGFDLFIPDTDFENVKMHDFFRETKKFPKDFHVGASYMSMDGRWFSVVSGEPIEYDLNLNEEDGNCLAMLKTNENYEFSRISCTDVEKSFVCQDVQNSDNENEDTTLFVSEIFNKRSTPLVESESENYEDPFVVQNTSICGREIEIFDNDGNYVKTACAVFDSTSQETACVSGGMSLFVIDSKKTETQVLDFATSIFGRGQSSTIWINGRKESDDKWYTYSPMKKPLLEDIIENSKVSISFHRFSYSRKKRQNVVSSDGNCLILGAFGDFEIHVSNCDLGMYSICEYTKTKTEDNIDFKKVFTPNDAKIKLEGCDKTAILSSGYNSTLCLIEKDTTYVNAKKMCNSFGYQLCKTNTFTSHDFIEAATLLFDNGQYVDMWAEGKVMIVKNKTYDKANYDACKNDPNYNLYRNRVYDIMQNDCSKTTYPLCEKPDSVSSDFQNYPQRNTELEFGIVVEVKDIQSLAHGLVQDLSLSGENEEFIKDLYESLRESK